MAKLYFEDLINLEYKYIFDYFDIPLSFIGKINNKNYLFYYIDEITFFVVELTFFLAKELSKHKNLTYFFSEVIDEEKLNIVSLDYDNESVNYLTPDSLKNDLVYYLPQSDSKIDYDYNRNKEIEPDYDLTSELEFPLESKDVTVRVTDANDSSIYKVSTIEKVTRFISKSFETIKGDTLSKEELFLEPYAPGSFKIKFLIKQNEFDLFEGEEISLSYLIDILRELNYSGKDYLNLDLVKDEKNIELIEFTNDIYNELKDEQISLQFYKDEIEDDNYLTKLSPNPITDNNISVFTEAIEEYKKTKIEVKNETVSTKFVTGSVIYNRATILVNQERLKVKFDKELFKKIKDGDIKLILDKHIEVNLKIETEKDSKDDIINTKYTIMKYRYI